MLELEHVCILGCGRSGTSIYGELFQSIVDYTYYSEPTYQEFSQIDFSSPVAINRFEDMIADPMETADRSLHQLEVVSNNHRPVLEQWVKRLQDQNNGEFVEALCSRPYSTTDHSVKVGRWKENLTQSDIDQVLPIVSNGAALFGYRLP